MAIGPALAAKPCKAVPIMLNTFMNASSNDMLPFINCWNTPTNCDSPSHNGCTTYTRALNPCCNIPNTCAAICPNWPKKSIIIRTTSGPPLPASPNRFTHAACNHCIAG